jgi:hypothetical protein
MPIKNWFLRRVNGLTTRVDLPRPAGVPRSPVLGKWSIDEPALVRRDPRRSAPDSTHTIGAPTAPNLGPYAALVAAIREELETFVVSYLRLHLAIAERDRYLLTSIDVSAPAPDDAELLRRFMREFKPEQIKHYLAKEVIGALPNAAAIDLTQFAGLNAGRDEDEDDEGYSELLAELKSARPGPVVRPFEVSLIGRWSEAGAGANSRTGVPSTPLAGRSAEIAIEDGSGRRHVLLRAVAPGRRFAIGKDERCDIVVNGVYVSRRHCEVWLDHGAWWVADTGSTNGVRVERAGAVLGRSVSPASLQGTASVIEVTPGARIVLSAQADGTVADYPRVTLDVGREAAAAATPVAPAVASPATPSTPIVNARGSEWTITARMASGVRTVDLRGGELPFSIGRSRNQKLVVDWAHEGVSGHHLDISAIDAEGASVIVHGDNGVRIGGRLYPPGAQLRWKAGESMALGSGAGHEPECGLTLAHRG